MCSTFGVRPHEHCHMSVFMASRESGCHSHRQWRQCHQRPTQAYARIETPLFRQVCLFLCFSAPHQHRTWLPGLFNTTERIWRWTDGSPVIFEKFHQTSFETIQEMRILTFQYNGYWIYVTPSDTVPFICEKEYSKYLQVKGPAIT